MICDCIPKLPSFKDVGWNHVPIDCGPERRADGLLANVGGRPPADQDQQDVALRQPDRAEPGHGRAPLQHGPAVVPGKDWRRRLLSE